jgi:phosphopantetheine adenylyltransferase
MTHKIQIDDLVRDATPDEIKAIKEREAHVIDEVQAEAAKAQAKAALFERLGMTAEEAALLLS